MTYLVFLIFFLIPPILAIYAALWRAGRVGVGRIPLVPILVLASVALVYTTPWDNYLVANRVWWYRTDWVLGFTLGWVPVEEYLFFVLQTLLTGGWTALVFRLGEASAHSDPARPFRPNLAIAAALAAAGVASAGALIAGPPQLTYLALILVWALPPLALQAGFGADILWHRRRQLLLSIGLPTAYLILADALAIRSGTWVINPQLSLNTRVAGFPLEEALFFLVTNVLVAVGLTLWLAPAGRSRAMAWTRKLGWRRRPDKASWFSDSTSESIQDGV
jgi:lycopene cyclase domain-containing protein